MGKFSANSASGTRERAEMWENAVSKLKGVLRHMDKSTPREKGGKFEQNGKG